MIHDITSALDLIIIMRLMRVYGAHVISPVHHYASECIIRVLRAGIFGAIYHGQTEITNLGVQIENPKRVLCQSDGDSSVNT